jgi:hypothetical protein
MCINVGHAEAVMHYALLDFEFVSAKPSLPTKITVHAPPWNQETVV